VRPFLLLRAFEAQSRGVLHIHAVLARGTWSQKVATASYGQHLGRLAGKYGFGAVDTPIARARHAREAAAYVSSYLTQGKGQKRTLGETVRSDQLPHSVIHISTVLTMRTGVTMRALRFRRLLKSRWGVSLPFPEQRCIQHLVEAFPGSVLERGPP
jgi:hypothetical protein